MVEPVAAWEAPWVPPSRFWEASGRFWLASAEDLRGFWDDFEKRLERVCEAVGNVSPHPRPPWGEAGAHTNSSDGPWARQTHLLLGSDRLCCAVLTRSKPATHRCLAAPDFSHLVALMCSGVLWSACCDVLRRAVLCCAVLHCAALCWALGNAAFPILCLVNKCVEATLFSSRASVPRVENTAVFSVCFSAPVSENHCP
jgi:hypothetical protein